MIRVRVRVRVRAMIRVRVRVRVRIMIRFEVSFSLVLSSKLFRRRRRHLGGGVVEFVFLDHVGKYGFGAASYRSSRVFGSAWSSTNL